MPSPESMDWAAQYASGNKLFEIPLKSNGYPVDGQQPITPAEKARILLELASSVDEKPVVTVDPQPPATENPKLVQCFMDLKTSILSINAMTAARIDIPESTWHQLLDSAEKLFAHMENPSA